MSRLRMAKLQLLTVREVHAAGEGDHADGGGLLLRVRGNTSSWVLRFTAPSGRRREMGLGNATRAGLPVTGDELTLARKLAREARDLLQQGKDPIDERQKTREAAKEAAVTAKLRRQQQHLTLARATRDYHERVIEPRLSAKHSAQWIASLENHMPRTVWNKPIGEIAAPELLAALSSIRSLEQPGALVPETLRRIRQRLDSVFEDAMFHGHCHVNPAAALRRKIREAIPANDAGAFRALDYREAPALLMRVRSTPGAGARCLEFAVLTAARTTEALNAQWGEFDLGAGIWLIPAERMKAREAHVVHLPDRAREILRVQLGANQQWVFPSPAKENGPLSNMALLATLNRLGMRERTTVHGLCRATFSTWAYETAAARPDVIEACLAHREQDRVKAAYNRAKFTEERRELLSAWAAYLGAKNAHTLLRLA